MTAKKPAPPRKPTTPGHKPVTPPLKNAADVNAKPTILADGDKINTTASLQKAPEVTTPQSTPEGGFPRSQPHAEYMFKPGSAAGDAAQALAKGVTPVSVAAAIGAAVDGPDTSKQLESRDELHDSIDPATGVLTEEAVALRADRGISVTGIEHKG